MKTFLVLLITAVAYFALEDVAVSYSIAEQATDTAITAQHTHLPNIILSLSAVASIAYIWYKDLTQDSE